MAVPLPLPVPHSHRDEPDRARGDPKGPASGSTTFSEVRKPFTADNLPLTLKTTSGDSGAITLRGETFSPTYRIVQLLRRVYKWFVDHHERSGRNQHKERFRYASKITQSRNAHIMWYRTRLQRTFSDSNKSISVSTRFPSTENHRYANDCIFCIQSLASLIHLYITILLLTNKYP